MKFPGVASCLICDFVRQEIGNKLSLFGYLGACPAVELILPDARQPAVLTFVLTTLRGNGEFNVDYRVVNKTTGLVVATGSSGRVRIGPDTGANLIAQLPMIFGDYGECAIQLVVDGSPVYEGTFGVIGPQIHPLPRVPIGPMATFPGPDLAARGQQGKKL